MAQLPEIWRDLDRPFSQLTSWRPLLRQLDDFFNESSIFTRFDDDRRALIPSCDIQETEDHYLLSFDIPGVDKDQIDIQVHGNRLTVSAERRMDKDRNEGSTRLTERRYGRFERTMTLPEGVKAEGVEAQYVDGVLQLAVPKSPETRPQKIRIGSGDSGFLSRMTQKIAGSVGVGKENKESKGEMKSEL